MIGYLKGTLISKRPPWLVIDVGGVGYEVESPMSTFYTLPETGSSLTVVTHLVVREDAQLLYAFSSEAERGLFRRLIKVTGIGAKIALAVLSSTTVDGFYDGIRNKDLGSLIKVPGIGKKTAERLMIELSDSVPEAAVDMVIGGSVGGSEAEAQNALLTLGYKPAEVLKMLKTFDAQSMSTEELIREALRQTHGR